MFICKDKSLSVYVCVCGTNGYFILKTLKLESNLIKDYKQRWACEAQKLTDMIVFLFVMGIAGWAGELAEG